MVTGSNPVSGAITPQTPILGTFKHKPDTEFPFYDTLQKNQDTKKLRLYRVNEIYYINVVDSKTVAGLREIPIHENILELVKNTDFPLIKNISKQAFSKKCRLQLYKTVDKNSSQNFHTIRGTFIQSAIKNSINVANNFVIIQEIVGHTKSEKTSLTLDRYGKGFDLKLKQDIVNSVKF